MKRKILATSVVTATLGASLMLAGALTPGIDIPSPFNATVAHADDLGNFPIEEAQQVLDYYNAGRDEAAKLTLDDITDLIKVYNGAMELNSALKADIVAPSWFKSTLTAHRNGPATDQNKSQRHNLTRDFIQRIKGGLGGAAANNLMKKLDEIADTVPADAKYDGIRKEIQDFKDTIDPSTILDSGTLDQVLHRVQNDFTPEKIQEKIEAADTPAVETGPAVEAVDQAAAEKKQAIADSSMTDEEKASATAEVDKAAEAAKQAIGQAQDNDTVAEAQKQGTEAINAVSTESATKKAATDEIDKAANDKNTAIDNSNLASTEKDAAKAEVKNAADAAKQAINDATTNQAVTDAKDTGITTINNVSTASQVTPDAPKPDAQPDKGADKTDKSTKKPARQKTLASTGFAANNMTAPLLLLMSGLAAIAARSLRKREN